MRWTISATILLMSFKYPLPHAAKHARDLRKKSTPAEDALWERVRGRKFHGLKFRRQVPIGKFIVDFLCTNPPLIIEIDGPIHDFQIHEDKERAEAILYDTNIPILRFKNDEVLKDMKKVLSRMEEALLPHLIP